MTMNFRVIKTNLENILGAASVAGAYRVLGYSPQGQSAEQVKGSNRLVRVYFKNFAAPSDRAGLTGPYDLDVNYQIELTVSAPTLVDLAVLENDNATPVAKAAALAGLDTAEKNADDSFDELVDTLMQTLLDGVNVDVGSTPQVVSGRWVPGAEKEQPKERGGLVTITGHMMFNCLVTEEPPGAETTDAVPPAFDQTTDLVGDDSERTGVTI